MVEIRTRDEIKLTCGTFRHLGFFDEIGVGQYFRSNIVGHEHFGYETEIASVSGHHGFDSRTFPDESLCLSFDSDLASPCPAFCSTCSRQHSCFEICGFDSCSATSGREICSGFGISDQPSVESS